MDANLSWQSLLGKISKETTMIFISLSSKCKKNASVFQLSKPQNTIFLYKQSKNIYLYEFMYRDIHAKGSGEHLEYLLHAIQTPVSPREKDYWALWDMRQSWT